jgi:hypothetical protein
MTPLGSSGSIPIGCILAWNINSTIPNDYLICDGSMFDVNKYPKLYQNLGTNILPDMNNSLQTDFDGYYVVGYYWTTTDYWFWGGPNKTQYEYSPSTGIEDRRSLYFDKIRNNIKFTWNTKWIIKAK